MFTVVEMHYHEGRKKARQRVVGQLETGRIETVLVLYLWPLEFLANVRGSFKPQAILWHPSLAVVGHTHFTVRGLEAIENGPSRRWCAQKWTCEITSYQGARDWLKPDARMGQVQPSH
ncbi:MAG: hypothetical protein Q8R63_05320 [Ramlibacter sp.]|nr:hypothetical protein [Ramlibacter sp.]